MLQATSIAVRPSIANLLAAQYLSSNQGPRTASYMVQDLSAADGQPVPSGKMLKDMQAAAVEAAKMLRSIGSPYRLMILCLLMESEKTVSETSEAIGARQSLTSQHLTHLRLHGLVQVERRGHFAYYSLADTVAKDIVAALYAHYCADKMSR